MNNGWRKVLTFVLGAFFALVFILFVAGLVVRRDLLDPTLYTTALAENNVYERVYVDVLGDPAMQDKLAETLGIESNLIAGETYAELVSVFNLVLPPPRMQVAAERFFLRLTDYLAGETPELEPDLPLDDAVDADVLAERITTALVAGAMQVAAKALPLAVDVGAPLVEEQLFDYLGQVSAGRIGPIPTSLIGASVDHLTPDEQDGWVHSHSMTFCKMTGKLLQDSLNWADFRLN